MPLINIRSDGVLEQVAANMAAAPQWMPKIKRKTIKWIGPRATRTMKSVVGRNTYTGKLVNSVKDEYRDDGMTVEISPQAKRGRWDAGLILEFGTGPIAKCPYAPITAWAGAKGAPMPGAWLKIRREGVAAHPFLDDTLAAVEPDLDKAQDKLLGEMAAAALHGLT
jgi:hypothetical protein